MFARLWRAVWRDTLYPALSMALPRRCPICGDVVSTKGGYVCVRCIADMPLTGFEMQLSNQMEGRVTALAPYVEYASGLIYYVKGSRWVDLIHDMKYRGASYHAERLGEMLGLYLSRSKFYDEVDCVVGVPLHPLRQMSRGYNQSDLIAYGCAKSLGVEALRGVVKRRRFNRAQVKTRRDERWMNVDDLFRVSDVKRLEGRNILLVDDVFTTGATILSCVEEIHKSVPNCRIWVATFAVASR